MRQGICIDVDFPWLVLHIKPEVRQLPDPPMAYRIELCCAHHICQGVVVGVHCEVWGVEQVVPKLLTHCPLKCKEFKFAIV